MRIKKRLSSIAHHSERLKANTSGNFGIMAALCMVPIVLILGGAVDVYRITNFEAILQNATDSAALSAASISNITDIEKISEEYTKASLPKNNDIWKSVVVSVDDANVTVSSRDIKISAKADVPSLFLGLIGIHSTQIKVNSRSTQKATNIEISLVLDISGSMRGARFASLKDSAKKFVKQVLDNTSSVPLVSINLVPYGGSVNIGPIFDTYATKMEDSIVDPTGSEYDIGSDIAYKPFRFSDGLNCLENRNEDYNDDSLLPEHSRAQVPSFWVWIRTNPWCPKDESAILLNTNDRVLLNKRIDNFVLSDGTGSAIGLLWGMKFLSPAWRGKLGGSFPARPADYNDAHTKKIVVFMTDGAITWQGRPRINEVIREHVPINRNRMQWPVKKGSYADTSKSVSAYGRLKRVCELLKKNGVKVFTIGFQIPKNSQAAKQMSDCAVNGGNYYLVNSSDLSTAFSAISTSISNLKIEG